MDSIKLQICLKNTVFKPKTDFSPLLHIVNNYIQWHENLI